MKTFEKRNEEMQGLGIEIFLLREKLQSIANIIEEEKRTLNIKSKNSSGKTQKNKVDKLKMEYISTDVKISKLLMRIKEIEEE